MKSTAIYFNPPMVIQGSHQTSSLKSLQERLSNAYDRTYNTVYKTINNWYFALRLKYTDPAQYDNWLKTEKEARTNAITIHSFYAFERMKTLILKNENIEQGLFYKLTAHQGLAHGALLAPDFKLNPIVTNELSELNTVLTNPTTYTTLKSSVIQAIYEMNSVIKEAQQAIKDHDDNNTFNMYDAETIETIITTVATKRTIPLYRNKPFIDSIKDFVKNTSIKDKVTLLLPMIAVIHIAGYALPASIRYYMQYPFNALEKGIRNFLFKCMTGSNYSETVKNQPQASFKITVGNRENGSLNPVIIETDKTYTKIFPDYFINQATQFKESELTPIEQTDITKLILSWLGTVKLENVGMAWMTIRYDQIIQDIKNAVIAIEPQFINND